MYPNLRKSKFVTINSTEAELVRLSAMRVNVMQCAKISRVKGKISIC